MIGRHCALKTCRFGLPDELQKLRWPELLMRGMVSDANHHAIWPRQPPLRSSASIVMTTNRQTSNAENLFSLSDHRVPSSIVVEQLHTLPGGLGSLSGAAAER